MMRKYITKIILLSTISLQFFNLISSDDEGCPPCSNTPKKKVLPDCYIEILDNSDISCGVTREEVCQTCCSTPLRTAVHFRSQGANTARELVGWQWLIFQCILQNNCNVFSGVYEYQRSFRSERLANSLFGSNVLSFSGSLAPGRTSDELLADNFGLSRNFKGQIKFCPQIENHIFDFEFYSNLNYLCDSLFVRIHAPLTYTIWQIDACETIESTSPTFDPCYMDNNPNEQTPTASSIQEALSGNFTFGDMKTPWCAGKFCLNKKRKKIAFADIDFIVGYYLRKNPYYYFGGFLQLVFPTGSKRINKEIFEPIVGNGRHFELGFGLTSHFTLWNNIDSNISVFFEGNLTHLFSNRQCRLFDYSRNGTFSRYLLLKEYNTSGITPQYAGSLINANCFNNREAKVKINIKGDFSVKVSYLWKNLDIDIGYNVYGHTKEIVKIIDQCCNIDTKKFAIKGTEDVCCFEYPIVCIDSESFLFPDNAMLPPDTKICVDGQCKEINPPFEGPYEVEVVKNNASQPLATAFNPRPLNSQASNSCKISLSSRSRQVTAPTQINEISQENGFFLCNENTPTRFVSRDDLNVRSGEALSVLSHKFFTFFNYIGFNCYQWIPQVGIGAEIEFDGTRRNDMVCRKSGLNQWGLWFKAGLLF